MAQRQASPQSRPAQIRAVGGDRQNAAVAAGEKLAASELLLLVRSSYEKNN